VWEQWRAGISGASIGSLQLFEEALPEAEREGATAWDATWEKAAGW
jgi:hypothetical protein